LTLAKVERKKGKRKKRKRDAEKEEGREERDPICGPRTSSGVCFIVRRAGHPGGKNDKKGRGKREGAGEKRLHDGFSIAPVVSLTIRVTSAPGREKGKGGHLGEGKKGEKKEEGDADDLLSVN